MNKLKIDFHIGLTIRILLLILLISNVLIGQTDFLQFNSDTKKQIIDFEFGKHNRIFIIDKSGQLFYSSGQEYISAFDEKRFDRLFLSNELYARTQAGEMYVINDEPFLPTISERESCVGKNDLVYNSELYSLSDTMLQSCHNSISKPEKINHIYATETKLFGWNNSGIFIYNNGKWKNYKIPTRQDLDIVGFHAAESDVLFHAKNTIWLFDSKKYDLIKHSTKTNITQSKIDPNGNIWYCDGRKLFYHESSRCQGELTLNAFVIDGMSYPVDDSHLLPKGISAITLEFDNRILIPNTQFEPYYMIDGLHDSWLPLNENTVVANISPGAYVVKYKTSGSTADHEQIPLKIEASDNVIWLYILGGFTLFLLLISITQYYINRSKQKSLRKEIDFLRTKNLLFETEQRLHRLKINPHFLFNTLNNIQGLIASNQSQTAKSQLRNFSLMMRNVLDLSEKKHITIKDDSQFIKKYLALEQMNHNAIFDFQIEIEESCTGDEHIIPMTTQIAVENAIIHGLKPLGRNGLIHVIYRKNRNGLLQVIVRDNGNGLDLTKDISNSKGIKFTKEKMGGRDDAYQLKNILEQDQVVGTEATLNFF